METTVLASDLRFPEGPIWFSDDSVVLVEIARGTLTRVSAEGDVDVVADLKGGPNGAAVGPDGKIYVCNNGGFVWHEVNGMTMPGNQAEDYTGGKIQRVDIETGEVDVLYDEVDGIMLRGPNDLPITARLGPGSVTGVASITQRPTVRRSERWSIPSMHQTVLAFRRMRTCCTWPKPIRGGCISGR